MDQLRINTFVTEECTRSCQGCYYPHSKKKMTPEAMDFVAKWITAILKTEEVKQTNLHFLGGETLLNLEAVFTIVDYVTTNKPEYTVPYYLLFTNGDPLMKDLSVGEKILKELKKRRFMVLINPTYDSFENVERKVEFVKSICGGCSISVALNDFNMARILDLVTLAIKYDAHIRISRLYQGGRDPNYIKEYTEKVSKALDMLLEAEKPMMPNFVVDSVFPTWKGKENPYACGKRLIIIDPDGTIRSCSGDLSSGIGSIYTCNRIADFKFPQRKSAKNKPECQKCEWVAWCQGGCPQVARLAYGSYEAKDPFCPALKVFFPKLMKLVEKWEKWRLENG